MAIGWAPETLAPLQLLTQEKAAFSQLVAIPLKMQVTFGIHLAHPGPHPGKYKYCPGYPGKYECHPGCLQ